MWVSESWLSVYFQLWLNLQHWRRCWAPGSEVGDQSHHRLDGLLAGLPTALGRRQRKAEIILCFFNVYVKKKFFLVIYDPLGLK